MSLAYIKTGLLIPVLMKRSFSFKFFEIFVEDKHLIHSSTSLELKSLRDSTSIPIIFNDSSVWDFVTWFFLFQRLCLLHSVKRQCSRLTQQLLEFTPISVLDLAKMDFHYWKTGLRERERESNILSYPLRFGLEHTTSFPLIGKLGLWLEVFLYFW